MLASILILSTGLFILFQTFNTDQYLSRITQKASLDLGRPVSVGHVGLGLSSQGIALDIGPVIIADDRDFTSQPFIKINRVRVSLNLRPLILQGEIHIKSILLQSPQFHFIRSQEGKFNVSSIGQKGQSAGDNTAVMANPSSGVIASEAKPSQGGAAPPSEPLSIIIKDASISFIDQSQTMPLDVWLTGINAAMNGIYLDRSKRTARINDLNLMADLNQIDVKEISTQLPNDTILNNIAGVVQLNIGHLEIGTLGGLTVNGDINITGGVIKNFNIIKTVLPFALKSFSGIEGNIDNFLNGPLKSTLGADDTTLEKASAQFSFHDKAVFIDNSLIKTNILELTAKGSVDQGSNVDMQTMLHLNSDVSAALVNELDGLKYLCDDSKRIAIGASLKGVIPHLKYKPNKDFRKKSRKALIKEVGGILNALFR